MIPSKYVFYRKFTNWYLRGGSKVSYVESVGSTLEDLLENAFVFVADTGLPAHKLPLEDYDRLVQIFTEYLTEADRARRN